MRLTVNVAARAGAGDASASPVTSVNAENVRAACMADGYLDTITPQVSTFTARWGRILGCASWTGDDRDVGRELGRLAGALLRSRRGQNGPGGYGRRESEPLV